MKPYLNVNENFQFYLEKNKIEKINLYSLLKEKDLNLINKKKNIYSLNNKKILFLNITTYGNYKNIKIEKKLRVSIPGDLFNEKIDFILCFHKKTNLFMLFKNDENSIIVNDKNNNSLLIYFWKFFYYKNFDNFYFFYKLKKKSGYCSVFKEKKNLIKILNNKIKFKKLIKSNKEIMINLVDKKMKKWIKINKNKLLIPYWDINKNFDFYFQKFQNKNLDDIAETLIFKKEKHSIFKWKKKNILFLKVITFSLTKFGQIGKLRMMIPAKSYKKNIDYLLGFHIETELFFLWEKSVITNVDTASSLSIPFWLFFYFKKFGNFKWWFQSKQTTKNGRMGNCWIFKEKNTLFELLKEKIELKKNIEEKSNEVKSCIKQQTNLLKIRPENKELLEDLKKNDDSIHVFTEKNIKKINKRMNQQYWRNRLLFNYKNECLLTSYKLPEILEACHVKPYRELKNIEKTDPKNGIMMSPTIHKFFDRGLFSFNEEYKIIFSNSLDSKNKKILQDSIKNEKNYSEILKKNVKEKYITYHRKNIFKLN